MEKLCHVRISIYKRIDNCYGCGVEVLDRTNGDNKLLKIMSVHIVRKDFATITSIIEHLFCRAIAEFKHEFKNYLITGIDGCFNDKIRMKRKLSVHIPGANLEVRHTTIPKSSCVRLGIDAALKKRTIIEKF